MERGPWIRRRSLGHRVRTLPGEQPLERDATPSDARRIAAQYGLEPVIDSGLAAGQTGGPEGVQFRAVQCPYCGERFETQLDTSAGSTRYVEACQIPPGGQICCQPIEFRLDVDPAGVLQALTTLRGD